MATEVFRPKVGDTVKVTIEGTVTARARGRSLGVTIETADNDYIVVPHSAVRDGGVQKSGKGK